MTPKELAEKRAQKIEEARALLEKAEAENRGLTADEGEKYDGLVVEANDLKARLERQETVSGHEAELSRSMGTKAGGKEDPSIGMDEKEVEQYSLIRAMRAAASGDWREAGLEAEASSAMAKKLKKEPRSFFVPFDVLKRGLTVGTPTDGGYTVATDLLAQSFIEMLRNKMVINQAGAFTMSGLVGDAAIPKQTGGATAYWVDEDKDVTGSKQAVGQVLLTPKTVGALTAYSRKLLAQSSLDVEAFVRNDLATALALALDKAAIHGTGADKQPKGIAATTGIGLVVGGENGATPSWDNIVDLETHVSVGNADVGKLCYITNAKVRGKLKKVPVEAGTDSSKVWDRLSPDTPLNGYPALVTNQVRADLTKGTAVGTCSAVFFGNFADLLIGLWGGLDILVDPYTNAQSGNVRVVAFQDADIAVRHAESFSVMLDALTA